MKKQCKRKVWGLVNPLAHVMEGIVTTPDQHLNQLRARELSSLDALSKGKGGLSEWNDLVGLLNIAETLGRNGIGPEVLPVCEVAQDELIAAAKRFERTRVMGLSATALSALRELYAFHDLQRVSITRAEYEKMIDKTIKRIKSRANEVMDIAESA